MSSANGSTLSLLSERKFAFSMHKREMKINCGPIFKLQMEKLVQSTISSLGYLEKGVYYKEPDCFDSVRDLIRLLHGDDAQLTVRRICSSQNIVKNDLVPIMRADDTSDELFDAALRLTVNLCQPTLIVLNGKLPENNEEWHIYYETERNLARFINAFTDMKIFDVLSHKCTSYFDLEWEDRSEKNKLLIERIFVLLRFIFAIGTESGRYIRLAELEGSARRRMLLNFFRSGFAPLFLRLCKQPMEREFCLHIVAILSLAFKGIHPNTLFMDPAEVEAHKKQETEERLANLVDLSKKEEKAVRSSNNRNFLKGTFVVPGVKALASTNNLIVQRSTAVAQDNPIAKLSERKRKRKVHSRHALVNLNDVNSDTTMASEVDADLLVAVREFAHKMLDDDAFKKLMRITKDIAFASGRSLTHKFSEIYYHSLTRFALQFLRLSKLPTDKVSTVFSREAFHDIITYIELSRENVTVDKQNVRSHSLKMQYAISVYKEMLITLNFVLNSEKEEEKELSQALCHHIFQTEEYRDLGPNLMNSIKPAAATTKMLEDLVLANHYYIHLMDKVTRSGELIKVQKAKRIVKRRKKTAEDKEKSEKKEKKSKKKKGKGAAAEESESNKENEGPSREEIESIWADIQTELEDVLAGRIEPTEDISPINVLLKVDDEEHQQFACLQIQMALRGRRVCDAVGMYKAARSLWPETGTFGDDSMGVEEECSELRDLFFLELGEIAATYERCMLETYGPNALAKNADKPVTNDEPSSMLLDLNDLDKEEEEAGPSEAKEEQGANESEEHNSVNDEFAEEDEDKRRTDVVEIPLEFDNYVMTFSKPAIVYWYVYLLKNFERNSTELNKALLKLMHRIAFDLKSPSRFYLASLFYTFRRVDECLKKVPRDNRKNHRLYEIYLFGFHLQRKFLEHLKQRGPVMICELLFTKSAKVAFEIEHGYGTDD